MRRHGLVLLLFLSLTGLLAHCARQDGVQHPSAHPLVQPAADFESRFHTGEGGWTGGDGTLSVPLPDGRTVWLFGDSFLGTVAPDGSRGKDAPFVRNCLLVQDGSALETRCRAPDGGGADAFPAEAPDAWYWPAHGLATGGHLLVFLHRFQSTGDRLWQWRWTGNALARLDLPGLERMSIQAAPSDNAILYGVSLVQGDGVVYIFGIDDQAVPQQAHLARAPPAHLHGPWEYYDGRGWSPEPAATRPILGGVSTQYGVLVARGRFYLFTMDGRRPFSRRLVVYRADRPEGPWQGPLRLYTAPGDHAGAAVYNPFVHPQFGDHQRALVSYNRNPIDDPDAVYRNADLYRPAFLWVDLAAVDRYWSDVR
ncbi:DUF5005 domain-containing protein [Desulfatitalea alkaliphila]|uniref:DUF4185 domain-containing protein n=1 Tax=Desulfatitalea alkaliphila TaxID=2929485 RepID=A0AA41R0X1_9BACT|nr:DUF5005 domain-containing protein [Desulfatitalea alkaliphila]MCJ8499165.1 DUF4185 domain-containing protein [Desulfatitalea alkaliphila]